MSPVESPPPLGAGAGQAVLHLFGRVGDRLDVPALVKALEAVQGDGYQLVTAAMLGHKADLGMMALGADAWRLRSLQSEVVAAGVELSASYVSVTEVSEYAAGLPEEMLQARLHPQLPPEGKAAFCFYPMSKRRRVDANWYTLDFDERRELMVAHGRVGREFRGRILQLITGSTGLDDWEWGVSLFGVALDDLKDCVHQMRFDRASALYAEFGPFYTGMVADPETTLSVIGGR